MRSAADAFAGALDPEVVPRFADRAAWVDALDRHLADAAAAWPTIALPADAFAAHVARRLGPDATPAALAAARGADLWLALACARGDAEAIACFERTYFGEVEAAGARARATADMVAEVKARLRRVLFVAEGARPAAAAEFAGRGDLRGWVRVSALRECIRLVTRARREVGIADDALLDALSPADDPELGYIRDLYRDAFAAAFRDAVAALDARSKSLLRYQLVEGLTIDDIGALHGVHRATAARWLAGAREAIAAGTRERLASHLGIASAEIESIIRLVRSRLDVSFERLIGE